MSSRCFAETPIREGRVVLAGTEAHHLIHVMRAQPGSRVTLFDGSGAEFSAAVEQIGRGQLTLAVTGRHEVDRELPLEVNLGVALPKGERQRWLVEKAVELGVRRLVPLRTARSVSQPVQQALERLRRAVIEASKQCGRNRLMEIDTPQTLADYVAGSGGASTRLLAHPAAENRSGTKADSPVGGDAAGGALRQEAPILLPAAVRGPVMLAVGPEGGFAREEVSLALAAGWQAVHLGPRILRVETAAILLVALVTRR